MRSHGPEMMEYSGEPRIVDGLLLRPGKEYCVMWEERAIAIRRVTAYVQRGERRRTYVPLWYRRPRDFRNDWHRIR